MTTQIGKVIVGGGLYNATRNSVLVLLDFGGDIGIRLELAGNPSGELAGRRLKFETEDRPSADEAYRAAADELQFQQIGVVAAMDLRTVEGRSCLHLEWFSQDGHIIAEIFDPVISDEAEPSAASVEPDENDESNMPLVDDEADDPYQLFPADLDAQLQQSMPEADEDDQPDDPTNIVSEGTGSRSWDEVIPGIDPETKRMYEEWDQIFDGVKDEPLSTLFDPPITLKSAGDIANEAEAEEALRTLLARLALHCVAIDICEHFEPLQTYRWLLEEILPEAQIYPRLGKTGFISHYSTFESCEKCEAEFDARYQQENGDGDQ